MKGRTIKRVGHYKIYIENLFIKMKIHIGYFSESRLISKTLHLCDCITGRNWGLRLLSNKL